MSNPIGATFKDLPSDTLSVIANSPSLMPRDVLYFARVSRVCKASLDKERTEAITKIAQEHWRHFTGLKVEGVTSDPGGPLGMSFDLIYGVASQSLAHSWRHLTARRHLLSEEVKQGLIEHITLFFINFRGCISMWDPRAPWLSGQARPANPSTLLMKVRELIGYQILVANKLLSEPLSSDSPLQELRDRARQLELMEEETFVLKSALSLQDVNPTRFFEQAHVRLPSLPISFAEFIRRETILKKDIPLLLDGVEVLLNLQASFNPDFNAVTFTLKNAENGTSLGSFMCKKLWRYSSFNSSSGMLITEGAEEDFFYEEQGMLDGPKLYFYGIEDLVEQNVETGDRPFSRLLLQLMIEVFMQESLGAMQLTCSSRDTFVCYAGGLKLEHPRLALKSIMNEAFREARGQGKVFPFAAPDSSYLTFSLNKEDLISKKPEKLALVNFELEEEPISWTKQIERRPLLGALKLVLPQYFRKDLNIDQEKMIRRAASHDRAFWKRYGNLFI